MIEIPTDPRRFGMGSTIDEIEKNLEAFSRRMLARPKVEMFEVSLNPVQDKAMGRPKRYIRSLSDKTIASAAALSKAIEKEPKFDHDADYGENDL